jgi:pimeloyl-ACP methyl ester carboxylesterase
MAFVTSDGASLFVDFAGDGSPVLLLHEFSLDHRQWEPQWADLAATHQVFRLDQRGHGASAAPPRGNTWNGLARDVQRVLVQIGMDRLNPGWIVAHSFAADAALQAALAEPRAVRGVVVVAPAVSGHTWSEDWNGLWTTMRDLARGGDLAGALARFRADPLFDAIRDRPDVIAAVTRMQAGCKGGLLLHGEPDEGPPTLERLSGCKVPVLVLAPEQGRADFDQAGREIAAATPSARRVEIAGCGHFANLQAPTAFLVPLRQFLAGEA